MKRISCSRFEDEEETEEISLAGHPDLERMPLKSVGLACTKALIRRGDSPDPQVRRKYFVSGVVNMDMDSLSRRIG